MIPFVEQIRVFPFGLIDESSALYAIAEKRMASVENEWLIRIIHFNASNHTLCGVR
jgi:hypothetical protein